MENFDKAVGFVDYKAILTRKIETKPTVRQKNRREAGAGELSMKVGLHANMADGATAHLPGLLHPPFKELSTRLQGDYGGVMEHLWIDLELIESHARSNGRPRHAFRFAKRVSGRSRFGLPPSPDQLNVGHYSVRPHFQRIATLPSEEAISYALSLIYDSTEVLFEKQKRLGGFDTGLFRRNFLSGCRSIGYKIS